MKVRNLFFAVLASASVLAGCEKEQDLGAPAISVSPESLTFAQGGESKNIEVKASRDWTVTEATVPEGYVVEPMSGKASANATEVKITAPANTGNNLKDVKIEFSAGLVQAYLLVSQEGEAGSSAGSIADVIKAEVGDQVMASGVVMAKYNGGFVFSDGKNYLLVYEQKQIGVGDYQSPNIGDKVDIEGYRAKYLNLPQIAPGDKNEDGKWVSDPENKPLKVTVTGTAEVNHPEPQVLDGAAFDGITATENIYIQYKGQLFKDGNYYNVNVSGATKKGGIQYPSDELKAKLDGFVGQGVIVTGYFTGVAAGGTVVNVMAVSVENDPDMKFMTLSTDKVSFAAEGGEETVTVTTNIEWNFTTDNDNFEIVKEGEGLKITALENETTEDKTTIITITPSDASIEAKTVIVTQKGQSSGNELTIVLSAEEKPASDFPEGSTGETTAKTYTIDGYSWTFAPSEGAKFSWYTDKYILWGKKDAYILMPAVEGKKLSKVTILTGKGASTSVMVGVFDANGQSAVNGGDAIKLSEKNAEFSWSLIGTEANTAYQLRVCSAHNAQLQKLTLIYE